MWGACIPYSMPVYPGDSNRTRFSAWFTRVCVWVTVRLICFRARAQRSGTRNRKRERREADYEYEHEYECDSYVESCNPELNQARFSKAEYDYEHEGTFWSLS